MRRASPKPSASLVGEIERDANLNRVYTEKSRLRGLLRLIITGMCRASPKPRASLFSEVGMREPIALLDLVRSFIYKDAIANRY